MDTVIENSRKQMAPSAFEEIIPAEDEVSSESRLEDTVPTTHANNT